MSISFANGVDARSAARGLVPLCAGAGVYLFFLLAGDGLLGDSDSFWHIKIGQWIIDHRAVPYSDFYSLTKFGESWVSTSWLSQVLYAAPYSSLGWAGPVIMASLAIAVTAAIFIHLLNVHFETARSVLLAILALVLSMHHLLARPHILALPVMVAWVGALMAAADRRTYPSWLLLPLIALWSNLHGGFVLGLALIAPIALEALWSEEPERRVALAARWAVFAIGALAASCCTPYGWNTLFGAARILDLGELLSLISEWAPANFSSFGFFEAALLGLIALAFSAGIVVSLPRVVLVLGLTWMALTHVRNIEAFAFLVPLVLAKPLAGRWKLTHATVGGEIRSAPYVTVFASLTIVAAAWTSTSVYVTHHHFAFTATQTPAAAVDLLEQRQVQRIFNSYQFGGYLIARDVKPFIDGRAELYGEKFVMNFFHAVEGRKVDDLLRMLEDFRIEATLLAANSPAAQVLNHVQGWKRLYADEIAVVHVRTDQPLPNAVRAPEASR
ncbi:MAG: hypothetical protein AUG50_05830 [Betaproteobacteria bacterium 13_1_20CM_3_63_8]|nr:MAG: hypothetical protein AUG50_05830 [Betaproteobacteria bacterium 13_1_20CM_3_63_8]